ncbi:MAG: SRPBCC family protein [Pseudohongiellaceae bacterium]
MSEFTLERRIARPPSDVWDYLIDFANAGQWIPGTVSITRLDAGDVGRGSVLRLDGSVAREYRITYWNPKKCFVWKRHGRFHDGSYTYKVEAGDGSTRLRLKGELVFHGLWTLLAPFLYWRARRDCKAQIDAICGNLTQTDSSYGGVQL